jgi:hypothetical protein
MSKIVSAGAVAKHTSWNIQETTQAPDGLFTTMPVPNLINIGPLFFDLNHANWLSRSGVYAFIFMRIVLGMRSILQVNQHSCPSTFSTLWRNVK